VFFARLGASYLIRSLAELVLRPVNTPSHKESDSRDGFEMAIGRLETYSRTGCGNWDATHLFLL
jgi:hypothetical protein